MPQIQRTAFSQGNDLPGKIVTRTHTFNGPILAYLDGGRQHNCDASPTIAGNILNVSIQVFGSTSQFPPETPWEYSINVAVDEPAKVWIARFYNSGNLRGDYVDITDLGKEGGIRSLTYLDDDICSCIVKAGYKAIAFNGENYSGRKMVFGKEPQPGRANYKPRADGHMSFTDFPSSMRNSITSIYCALDP
jgi:hypothetical protein